MKLGCLVSGGKDSWYASYLAKQSGNEIVCLITIDSENPESYMFHTPSIDKVAKQAEVSGIPLVIVKTKGEKEKELKDLEGAIKKAIKDYGIEGVVTGAVGSVYQASRVQKITNKLGIECFNPLWQKNQEELLKELLRNKFKVVLVGVFGYPLDDKWVGREIDKNFLKDIKLLNEKYKISVAGEGGEFETFVLDCPMFKRGLKIADKKIDRLDNDYSYKMEIVLK